MIEIYGTVDGAQNMNKEWLFTISNNTGTRGNQLNDCTAGLKTKIVLFTECVIKL